MASLQIETQRCQGVAIVQGDMAVWQRQDPIAASRAHAGDCWADCLFVPHSTALHTLSLSGIWP